MSKQSVVSPDAGSPASGHGGSIKRVAARTSCPTVLLLAALTTAGMQGPSPAWAQERQQIPAGLLPPVAIAPGADHLAIAPSRERAAARLFGLEAFGGAPAASTAAAGELPPGSQRLGVFGSGGIWLGNSAMAQDLPQSTAAEDTARAAPPSTAETAADVVASARILALEESHKLLESELERALADRAELTAALEVAQRESMELGEELKVAEIRIEALIDEVGGLSNLVLTQQEQIEALQAENSAPQDVGDEEPTAAPSSDLEESGARDVETDEPPATPPSIAESGELEQRAAEEEPSPPELPVAPVVAEGDPTVTTVVRFQFGAEDVEAELRRSLEGFIGEIGGRPVSRMELVGHSDATGDRLFNIDLSRRRAEQIAQILRESGIDAADWSVDGLGPDEPVDTNDTPLGRYNNRRVEVRAWVQDEPG